MVVQRAPSQSAGDIKLEAAHMPDGHAAAQRDPKGWRKGQIEPHRVQREMSNPAFGNKPPNAAVPTGDKQAGKQLCRVEPGSQSGQADCATVRGL